jgi:DNA-binding response OmpR family regulator
MKLLLVEDDGALVAAVTRGLRGAGFAVDAVGTAADCLRLLGLGEYDVLVLDLGLPDADGLALLQRLRDRELATPVLVLGARGEITERVAGLDAGADDYLQKPFAFPEYRAPARRGRRRRPNDVNAPEPLLVPTLYAWTTRGR